ncbi:hypothetical protein RFI_25230, partial [Reticulomyxa filosa]
QPKVQENTQIEEKKQEEKNGDEHNENDSTNKNCENMLSFVKSCDLKNGVDFLLINENDRTIKLKNNEWNSYNFGVFLLGENTILTVHYDKKRYHDEFGHLKMNTSHLWIKHSFSKIHCSQLGYPKDQGPGKGGRGKSFNGGGGYGTKGGEGDVLLGAGKAGEMYGEETLLKEIHFGSGGGGSDLLQVGGNGGGIIELIIRQQLINHGSIQCNGGDGNILGGGGSGGSILIQLQCQSSFSSRSRLCPNNFEHTLGYITCVGGKQNEINKGGKGRIAIYGLELSSDNIKNIDPKPFNRIHK